MTRGGSLCVMFKQLCLCYCFFICLLGTAFVWVIVIANTSHVIAIVYVIDVAIVFAPEDNQLN